MSIKVFVYTPTLSTRLLPRISEEFAAFGMRCEFHPDFVLDPARAPGVVPVRIRVDGTSLTQYENLDMLSSFEISFKNFRYTSPPAFSPVINESLKRCTEQITIRMHAVPTSALRVGLYFASILAQVADGIVYFPRSDEYLEPTSALAHVVAEVDNYEREMPMEAWSVEGFMKWPDL